MPVFGLVSLRETSGNEILASRGQRKKQRDLDGLVSLRWRNAARLSSFVLRLRQTGSVTDAKFIVPVHSFPSLFRQTASRPDPPMMPRSLPSTRQPESGSLPHSDSVPSDIDNFLKGAHVQIRDISTRVISRGRTLESVDSASERRTKGRRRCTKEAKGGEGSGGGGDGDTI